jgi:ADP-dependent NAD(P)H-hydrate dehydratase
VSADRNGGSEPDGLPPEATVVTPAVLRGWPLPQPGTTGDKGDRGQVVVIGGSSETVGAASLAGVAAMRAGAGKLQLATAAPVAGPLAVALPEALVAGFPVTDAGALRADPATLERIATMVGTARAVLVGPGLSDPQQALPLVEAVFAALPADAVVVVDAMAATCGAVAVDGKAVPQFEAVAERTILTPNPAEAAWLLETDAESVAKTPVNELVRSLVDLTGAVNAMRGCVLAPDGRMWFGQSGHSGLGTSGSGDVEGGIIAGLAARGSDPAQAAVWGVHVHAEAGERLAARMGPLGFLARELLDEVPPVLAQLEA